MSKDQNYVSIIGRLTKDMDLSYINSGTALGKFSIANNDIRQVNNNWEDEVSFFNCILWGKRAEGLSKYMTKGTQISISGRLKQERWSDKHSGESRDRIIINVAEVQLLSKPAGQAARDTEDMFSASSGQFDEDIAF